jgi:hypothetical protein
MGIDKALPLITHQLFQKLPMPFCHQLIQVFKEVLVFAGLQPPPTGGRLVGEGFVGSHGCIAFR